MNKRGLGLNGVILTVDPRSFEPTMDSAFLLAQKIGQLSLPVVLGALFPDVDTAFGKHRKTLHNLPVLVIFLAFPLVFDNLQFVWIGVATHYVLDMVGSTRHRPVLPVLGHRVWLTDGRDNLKRPRRSRYRRGYRFAQNSGQSGVSVPRLTSRLVFTPTFVENSAFLVLVHHHVSNRPSYARRQDVSARSPVLSRSNLPHVFSSPRCAHSTARRRSCQRPSRGTRPLHVVFQRRTEPRHALERFGERYVRLADGAANVGIRGDERLVTGFRRERPRTVSVMGQLLGANTSARRLSSYASSSSAN